MTTRQHGGAPADIDLEHVELYVHDLDAQSALWRDRYGFTETGRGGAPEEGSRSVVLAQGAVRLVLTRATDERHPAAGYVRAHGDGVADIALRTRDLVGTVDRVVAAGGRVVRDARWFDDGEVLAVAAVSGFGDVTHTLVQYREDRARALPLGAGTGLLATDHFAVCVPAGGLAPLVDFYRAAFGFRVVFEERIAVGPQAMLSRVLQSASGTVTFTVLQPDPGAAPGQLDAFLKDHGGAGVQHVAFAAEDAVASVTALADRGVEFLDTPDAYYRLLADRMTPRRHTTDELRRLGLLVDEDHGGQLFQVFTRSAHPRRTLFFEIVERCGARTFGSANIKALYEAVEAERLAQAAGR
ncbi:4-hydroxyphenylpyruvate dioxygenase [Streptomyces ziwulingensis]|uniref:4-hydroxyphenylpyruvate dioxygenase n=1 Tax=Streptomyces ziwulingensis TaxID=1045501 RepID=A0ABP9D8R8_9ACTN